MPLERGNRALAASRVGRLVADAVDREDVSRIAGVGLQLAPHVLDVRVDRTIERLAGVAADRVEELRASEDAARLARQRRNQVKLRGREIDRCACPGNRQAIGVEDADRRGGVARRAASCPLLTVRRSTAFTRATSSRGLNGLVR